MNDVNFVKEPGILRDLCNIYIYYFNESVQTEFKIDINLLSDIPDNFNIFFYRVNGTKSFFANYLSLDKNLDFKFIQSDEFERLILNDKIFYDLFSFYFTELNNLNGDEAISSDVLSSMIAESDYSNLIKIELLKFIISPKNTLILLLHNMRKKAVEYDNFRKSKVKSIEKEINMFNFETFKRDLYKLNSIYKDTLIFHKKVYFSFVLINRHCLYLFDRDDYLLILLGIDYRKTVNINKSKPYDLILFGKVISEKIRLDILDILLEKIEMNNTEIAKTLSLTPASCYYHLDMMASLGILNFRAKGREVLYRINQEEFSRYGHIILQYLQKRRIDYEDMENTEG